MKLSNIILCITIIICIILVKLGNELFESGYSYNPNYISATEANTQSSLYNAPFNSYEGQNRKRSRTTKLLDTIIINNKVKDHVISIDYYGINEDEDRINVSDFDELLDLRERVARDIYKVYTIKATGYDTVDCINRITIVARKRDDEDESPRNIDLSVTHEAEYLIDNQYYMALGFICLIACPIILIIAVIFYLKRNARLARQ